jgi:hypothetical protein
MVYPVDHYSIAFILYYLIIVQRCSIWHLLFYSQLPLERILGLEGTHECVEDQGRLTRVAAVKHKTNALCTFLCHVDYLQVIQNVFPKLVNDSFHSLG